jgi:hypothetical protein
MTERFVLPASLKEAKESLTGISSLVMAFEWKRAGTVSALIDGAGVTVEEFVALGIQGLRRLTTVERYRRTWQTAIDAGLAVAVKPGQTVELPDAPWDQYYDSTDTDERYAAIERNAELRKQAEDDGVGPTKVLDIAKNKKAMASAIKGDPAVAAAALEALGIALSPEQKAALVAELVSDGLVLDKLSLDAIEAVEEAGIERHATEPYDEEETKRTGRRVASQMGRALQEDLATGALRNAAGSLGEAILCREEFGIEHPDEEAAELRRIERYLAVYKSNGDLTTKDAEWLQSIGISI